MPQTSPRCCSCDSSLASSAEGRMAGRDGRAVFTRGMPQEVREVIRRRRGASLAKTRGRGRDAAALVGRRAELRTLERLLADARAGEHAGVAVAGEPGIGKTRLLSELCARAEAAGFEVFTGRGSELE